MDVCTIVSRRELARARVLAETLHEHTGGNLTVLLLDEDPAECRKVSHGRLLGLESVLGPRWGDLAAANPPEALELALVPSLAARLIADGAVSVVFLSCGHRVLGSLDELGKQAERHQLLLVSRHCASRPLPPGQTFDYDPRDGAFSRGILAFGRDAEGSRLLADWPRCFGDAEDGAPAVRSWLDRIPALFDEVGIVRDPGYVLDARSLAEAPLERRSGELVRAGRPARLLDLGGLDPKDPTTLFSGRGRAQLTTMEQLAALVAQHSAELVAAGFEDDARWPAPFRHLEDGLHLTDTLRRELRHAISDGALSASPFSPEGRAQLYEFLNRPAKRGAAAGLTALHLAIWEARPDLKAGYRHLDGPDGAGFAGWLCMHGNEEEGLVPALLPPTPAHVYRDADPAIHEDAPRWGVNVAGFLTSEIGVGEAARLLIAGLDAAEVPVFPVQPQLKPSSRQGTVYEVGNVDDAPFPVNIICVNGDGVPVFAREAGKSFFEGRYTIGLWWWEVGDPPAEWKEAYQYVDEVWVGSKHIYDALAAMSPVPVVKITLPVLQPVVAQRRRAEVGLPDEGFVFLFVYDYHSVATRKNPLGLIDAFKQAFPPGSGAKLVLKSINGDAWVREHERVALAASSHPDISLVTDYMSLGDKNAMIALCDCYISLHRSEGFGLTLAEAMLLNKPVISTRYGGVLEFMTEMNSYLVDWTPSKVGNDAHPYPADGIWAEPDLDHAASLMRLVRTDTADAALRAARAHQDVLTHHSAIAAASTMSRRLEAIRLRQTEEGARSLNLAHIPHIARGPSVGSAPRDERKDETRRGASARLRRRIRDRGRTSLGINALADLVREQSQEIGRLREMEDARDRIIRDALRTLHESQHAQRAEALATLRAARAELDALRHRLESLGASPQQ